MRRLVVAVPLTLAVLALTFLVPDRAGRDVVGLGARHARPVLRGMAVPRARGAGGPTRHRPRWTPSSRWARSRRTGTASGRCSTRRGTTRWRWRAEPVAHYFDTAAVIITLILVGKVLEARARMTAGDASRALLERAAKKATILGRTAQERTVPIDDLHPGHAGRRAARGEDPGRRRREGGHVVGRPVAPDRRVGARRRRTRRRGRRRRDQRSRAARRVHHQGRRRTRSSPRSSGSCSRRRDRRRPSSAWRTGSPPSSCRS